MIKVTKKEAEYVGLNINNKKPRIDIFLTYISRYKRKSVENYTKQRKPFRPELKSIEL